MEVRGRVVALVGFSGIVASLAEGCCERSSSTGGAGGMVEYWRRALWEGASRCCEASLKRRKGFPKELEGFHADLGLLLFIRLYSN